MINLIPPAARGRIIKEYWFRVGAVWLFLFGTGCLLVTSLLLPTYMLLRGELSTLRNEVAANEAMTASFDTSAAELMAAMQQTNRLLGEGEGVSATAYDAALLALAGDAVEIQALIFENATTSTKITLSGVAASRSALANFRDAVEASADFSDAVLPISSLIKDRDLDFTMTITGGSTSTPAL
jgi:hypothetical protein